MAGKKTVNIWAKLVSSVKSGLRFFSNNFQEKPLMPSVAFVGERKAPKKMLNNDIESITRKLTWVYSSPEGQMINYDDNNDEVP